VYREICENPRVDDNRSLKILLVRLFIRYTSRAVGYKISSLLFCLILHSFKSFVKDKNYLSYVLRINAYRNLCMYFLSKKDNFNYRREKKEWAQYIIRNSEDKLAINNASDYLDLLYNFKNYKYRVSKNYQRVSDIFYIYGPNSKRNPSKKYSDCRIVLTKPIEFDVSIYRGSELFLNSFYFHNSVLGNYLTQKSLLSKYSKVHVSCMHAKLPDGFNRIKSQGTGYLSGPMALGRVLQTLTSRYGRIKCIIEGFDLYLDSKSYNLIYPSSLRLKNGRINEKGICSSLAHHDAEYNFLYLKKIADKIDFINSEEFRSLVNMSSGEYMKKLFEVRNFSKI